MRKNYIRGLLIVLSTIPYIMLVSCEKEFGPAGSYGGKRIRANVSSMGMATKSGTSGTDGHCVATYAIEGVVNDPLFVSVFEYDNNDLPEGMAGEELQTKGSVVTSESINAVGQQFRMNAWLEEENRYDGSQDGDGRVYEPEDSTDWHFIKDALVERNSSGWVFEDGAEYLWRNQVKTNFWSVYPVSPYRVIITYPGDQASDEDQTRLFFKYSQLNTLDQRDAQRSQDFCFAYNTRTWSDRGDDKVDIKFHHALSALYVSTAGVIDGVKVETVGFGHVAKAGECVATGNPDSTVDFDWSPDGIHYGSYTQSGYTAADFDPSTNVQDFYSSDKVFMVIPQQLDGTTLSVTFRLSDNTTVSRAVDISKDGDGNSIQWKPGKKYLYRISAEKIDYDYIFGIWGTPEEDNCLVYSFDNTTAKQTESFYTRSFRRRKGSDYFDGFVDIKVDFTTDSLGKDAPEEAWKPFNNTVSDTCGISGITQTLGGSDNYILHSLTVDEKTDIYPNPFGTWSYHNVDLSVLRIGGVHDDWIWIRNTANCYIIRWPGTNYHFPCVYGNAIKNRNPNPGAYTSSASGEKVLGTFLNADGNPITSPYVLVDMAGSVTNPKAALLWCDTKVNGELLVNNVSLSGSGANASIYFDTPKWKNVQEGNAVIVLYDDGRVSANGAYDEGEALWSWHIWVSAADLTESGTGEIGSEGGAYGHHFFMSRNLGECRNGTHNTAQNQDMTIRLTQAESGKVKYIRILRPDIRTTTVDNTYYQWGRKDPFNGCNKDGEKPIYDGSGNVLTMQTSDSLFLSQSAGNAKVSVMNSIRYPLTYALNKDYDGWYVNLWSVNSEGNSVADESAVIHKTIYDPCPYGYCLPNRQAFRYFTSNGSNVTQSSLINGEWMTEENYLFSGFRFLNSSGEYDDNLFFPATAFRFYRDSKVSKYGFQAALWCGISFYRNNIYGDMTSMKYPEDIAPTNFVERGFGCAVRPVLE